MDFGTVTRKGKVGADGHYEWESPGLRRRLDEEKKAKELKKVTSPPPFYSTPGDYAMIQRDRKPEGSS